MRIIGYDEEKLGPYVGDPDVDSKRWKPPVALRCATSASTAFRTPVKPKPAPTVYGRAPRGWRCPIRLKAIFLAANSIGDAGAEDLLAAMHQNTAIVRLVVDHNRMSDANVELIEAKCVANSMVEKYRASVGVKSTEPGVITVSPAHRTIVYGKHVANKFDDLIGVYATSKQNKDKMQVGAVCGRIHHP
jgi:hypothetical protein